METALISATVAAIVTLLIEYTAKPRLEARKERILTGQRHAREVRAAWNRVNFEFGRLLAWERRPPVPLDRLRELAANIRRDVRTILDLSQSSHIALSEFDEAALLHGTVDAEMLAVMIEKDADLDEVFSFARQKAEPAMDAADAALELRWWHRRTKARYREILDIRSVPDRMP